MSQNIYNNINTNILNIVFIKFIEFIIKHTFVKKSFQYISIIIITLLIISPIGLITELGPVPSNANTGSFSPNLKVNDFAEYSLHILSYKKVNETGFITNFGFFQKTKTGYFRWTVLDSIEGNITLKIEVNINDFYSNSKSVIISNRIAYDEQFHQLGYVPFWIPQDLFNNPSSINITLDGNNETSIFGTFLNNNSLFFLGGIRGAIMLTSGSQTYPYPGVSDQGGANIYTWTFSKNNGILVELGSISPILWTTLHYPYRFNGKFILSKTNIDFGQSDAFATFMHQFWSYFGPYYNIILIIIVLVLILLVLKFKGKVLKYVRREK